MMLSKDDSLMCTSVLGNVYFKFCKFSCELLFVLFYAAYSDEYIIVQGNRVPILTSTNFKHCKSDVMIALAYANVDIAMTDPKPPEEDAKTFQAWNTSNRVCLMTLK